jgi:hypothetical protein
MEQCLEISIVLNCTILYLLFVERSAFVDLVESGEYLDLVALLEVARLHPGLEAEQLQHRVLLPDT